MVHLLFLGLGALAGAAFVSARDEEKFKTLKPSCPPALPVNTFAQSVPNKYGVMGSDPRRSPTGSDTAPRQGVQSHPDYQWTYVVGSNEESPGAIADKILGPEQGWRYVELLTANPKKEIKGKIVSPDPNVDELNFVSLTLGEKLAIPRSWNPWIDETGVPAGRNNVWPAPTATQTKGR